MGHHKSAFYAFTRNIKEFLKKGKNELIVRVTSGLEYVSELDIAAVKNYVGAESHAKRGDKRRVFVRKPQYVYGWDWGPRVASCGIMKSVYIKSYKKLAVRSVYAVTSEISPKVKLKFEECTTFNKLCT